MSVEDRIARLERQNRQLRAVLLAIGLGLATAAAIGAVTEDRFFFVRDADGRRRIALESHPVNGPFLYMLDKNDGIRLEIGLDDTRDSAPYIQFRAPGPDRAIAGPIVKRIE